MARCNPVASKSARESGSNSGGKPNPVPMKSGKGKKGTCKAC